MSGTGRTWVKAPPATRWTAFLRPHWLLLHLVFLGAAVGMVLLGRWQLHVSEADGWPLQNTSYVVQWWAFAAAAVWFWARLVRDARRPPPTAPSPGGEVVLRSEGQGLERSGPAQLVRRDRPDAAPVAYRGYVLPDSSRAPHRSYGDELHDSYNDYLWQMSLADAADSADQELPHDERDR